MSSPTYDVLAVGNAIVDVIAHAHDSFLAERAMTKGGMALIDEATAEQLYGEMGPGIESSGGSAGNTVAGIASFGGKAAFVGKVRDDSLGDIFRHDLRSIGVAFDTPAESSGPSTARCLILVTPDAERTMNTFLGACTGLTEADIDEAQVASAAITYLEGYLFDLDPAKAAFRKAAAAARKAGRKVALTMSDSFCVHRHHQEFLDLIAEHIDILFANEDEIRALYGSDDLHAAARIAKKNCDVVAVTCGSRGAILVDDDGLIEVPVRPVDKIVDTTGAGDLFAAGMLFGLSQGRSLEESGRLGNAAAGEVISHVGARPQMDLKDLLPELDLA